MYTLPMNDDATAAKKKGRDEKIYIYISAETDLKTSKWKSDQSKTTTKHADNFYISRHT